MALGARRDGFFCSGMSYIGFPPLPDSFESKLSYVYDPQIAVKALKDADTKLARMIDRIGPYRLRDRSAMTPFQALLQSIVYQQLSGRAAGSIHARVQALFPRKRPTAKHLLAISDDSLRGAGLSRGKVLAVRDLAKRCVDGSVPSRVRLKKLDDEDIIQHDPNRTLIPGIIVDAVVCEPFGTHPSYVQGYYDRDNEFYLDWGKRSRDQQATEAWLQEWVYDLPDRAAYLKKLGQERLDSLAPGEMMSNPVNYGRYD